MKSAAITSGHTQQQPWKLAFVFCFLVLLCDGADIGILSFTLSSLKQEFGLTNIQAGSLGSWSLFGMAVGGFFGGWACDRFGRVRVIVIAVATFALLSGCVGFAQTYEQFIALRILACIGLGSLYVACNTLMSEMVPTKHRTTVLAAIMTGYTLGSLVITTLSAWIIPSYGWRILYFISFTPIILAVLMYFLVSEPESWKEARALKLSGANNLHQKPENPHKAIFNNPKHRIMFI